MHTQVRQLAAIMFTDIVGYTALMGEDEQKAFSILNNNRKLQKPIIEKYNGRWIKELGDGVLASFNTVSDAVYAAKEIQHECKTAGEFSLRIGLDHGEIVYQENDIYGDAVNIASRIQSIASVGGIYVSESVHHNVVNKKNIISKYVKTERLKHVSEPIRIFEIETDIEQFKNNVRLKNLTKSIKSLRKHFLIIFLGAVILFFLFLFYYLYSKKQITNYSTIDSIAVLPFVNQTGSGEMEYLSDGMTETLINNLSKLKNLSVKARTSTFQLKGRTIDLKKLGNELSVQAILNGSVGQRDNTIVLSLELVDIKTGNQIWGEQYNRKLTDLLVLQSEIARDVTNKLKTILSNEDKEKLEKNYTFNSEAYQLYLRGRFHWNKRTANDLQIAIKYFEQAIKVDPGYAIAYAGIADCYNFLAAFGIGVLPPKDAMPEAKMAALKALEIDETLAEAHASLAFIHLYYHWDWRNAEKEFKRAIELNPNYAPGHQWYSHLLMATGRTRESLSAAKTAVEIDALAHPTNLNLGWQLYYAGLYDEAIKQIKKTLELEPGSPQARWILGLTLEQKKNYSQAIEEFHKAANLSEKAPVYLAALGHSYAASGMHNQAREILQILMDQSNNQYVSSYWTTMIYSALNKPDLAFASLNKAYLEQSGGMIWIKREPKLATLRNDPYFEEIVNKVGFH